MPALKAEVLQRILSDASDAQPINGMPHTYAPEEYNKVMAKNRAMGLMEDGSQPYSAKIPEGAVEFDAFGNLRKIGRTAPKMLDLNTYTQNRYMIDKKSGQSKKVKKEDGTEESVTINTVDILVVLGEPIVKAITAMNELPKTVKAFRFSKTDGKDWVFKGAEFIEDKVAYQMTRVLAPTSALKLIQMIEAANNKADKPFGDSLDEIA